MKKILDKEIFKKIPWATVAILFVIIISVTVTAVVQKQVAYPVAPHVHGVDFDGAYRIGNGEWKSLSDAKHISAMQGPVELKGIFLLCDGETGEQTLAAHGTAISLYLDHVHVTITDADGNVWMSDNENERIGKGACASTWNEYVFSGEAGDEVTVTIRNPHVFGNSKAVDRFLEKLCLSAENNGDMLFGAEPIAFAIVLLLLAFLSILPGVSLFVSLLRKEYDHEIWLLWLLAFFGGIYLIFSLEQISVWIPRYVVNTMVHGISAMLYLLTAFVIAARCLYGAWKKTAVAITVLIGCASLASVLASLHPTVRFYDAYPYWMAFASLAAIVMIACVCMAMACRRKNGDMGMKRKIKRLHVPFLAVSIAFLVDVLATAFGIWQGGLLSVCVFLIVVLISMVVIRQVLTENVKTILDVKNIEAEKRAMELKLQESHISIMLSQIQPHFLYNTLNSIYYLCETNPMRARSMVNSFAEYLRNNLSTLEATELVSFETELSHINTYLDIEKIRFEDTLEIEYDIQCIDFSLPVLTVQPIVENAVKHGTSKKRGGGKVMISTEQDKESYIITVSDTGCGFDPAKPQNDGKRHIGIENVRQRLSNMCGGSLTIESKVGVGTVAVIRIPKGSKK